MEVLEVERDGSCVVMRLNRPAKRNALSTELLEALATNIEALGADPDVRGIVLAGTHEHFSTGVDLAEAAQVRTPEQFAVAWERWATVSRAIEASPLPVIAAVNGYCLTGGLEIALACDYRMAGTNAKFGITSAKIGSVAGMGGTQRLPRVVGPSKAKRMLFTAEFVGAEAALEIGLIDEVCEVDKTVQLSVDLVHAISANAPLSVAWHKEAVDRGLDLDLAAALELERGLCSQAFATDDRLEGMTAFLESRAPTFRRR
jgi:enoyl-CoA hydratase/carnithine racemase